MESIPISRFKATCLGVLEKVRSTRQPILVTRRGVPVAQVIPPPDAPTQRSGFGSMPFTELGDIVEAIDVEWEARR